MRKEVKLLRNAVANMVGAAEDNAYRARAAFKHHTPAQMQEQHGQSGRTRKEILDMYEEHVYECKCAQDLLNQMIGENHE